VCVCVCVCVSFLHSGYLFSHEITFTGDSQSSLHSMFNSISDIALLVEVVPYSCPGIQVKKNVLMYIDFILNGFLFTHHWHSLNLSVAALKSSKMLNVIANSVLFIHL
jgi:hypothetical protein